ncbi:superoxide dismutase family protein [Luteimonas arsenica]|uniref:superoxide dismutase family protein n=1 Tax=Luteimonas arsenica TaxID=1586242 RepID=UPI001FB71F97|nr:superoxide dismutase family protein [Luteimonas arsenica]
MSPTKIPERMRRPNFAPPAVALFATGLLAACASAPPAPREPQAPPPPPPRAEAGTASLAHANLTAASATLASGRITLRAESGGVRLSGDVGGLSRNGAHVLQVHARGDCSAIDASSAGPYFDASGSGAVDGGSDRIVANERGVARVDQLVRGAVLGGGSGNDIGGRSLVVLGSTAGATGARIACGVITLAPAGAP